MNDNVFIIFSSLENNFEEKSVFPKQREYHLLFEITFSFYDNVRQQLT